MNLLRLHHVALVVTDLDRSVEFYGRVLGLRPRDDRPSGIGAGAWLSGPGFEVHLSVGEPPTRVGQHFAIEVGDFDEAWAQSVASGEAVRAAQLSGDGTRRQFYISDPSRNWIEIREAGAA